MKIENWNASGTAKVLCAGATLWTMMAVSGAAQTSGVSHPPTTPIVDTDDLPVPAVTRAKPSAAIPMTAPTTGAAPGSVIPASSGETYGAYVPYRAAGAATATAAPTSAAAFDPDANIVTEATAGRHPIQAANPNDPDAGIVTHVVSPASAVAEGTLIKAKLREALSTETTRSGTNFSAVLSGPVMRDGQVIAPAGSILEGRVTYVRSGTRFNGSVIERGAPRGAALDHAAGWMWLHGARACGGYRRLGQDEGR